MRNALDLPLYTFSPLGLFVSIYIALVELASYPARLSGFAEFLSRFLMFGLLAVAGLFILRQVMVNYDQTQKLLEKVEAAGGPAWARIPAKLLLAIAMIVFSSQVFRERDDDETQKESPARWDSTCPRWMLALAKLCTGAGVLLFVFPLLLAHVGYLPADDGGLLKVVLPAGIGMIICPAVFVRVYASNALAGRSATP